MVVFLVIILNIWRPKKSFPPYLFPLSQGSIALASCRPLIIVFDCENSLHHPEQFRSIFSLILRSPSPQNYSFSAFSSHSLNRTGAPFKYPLISSWYLCSPAPWFSYVPSFISQNSSGDLCLCYFRFQFLWWFFQDSSSFAHHINLFVVSILPVVRWRFSQVCSISILTLFLQE